MKPISNIFWILGFCGIFLSLTCTDPLDPAPNNEVVPSKVTVELEIPSINNKGQRYKVGDQVKVTVKVTYPKYVEQLTVTLGEPENPMNSIEEPIVSESSSPYKRDILITYSSAGEKNIVATVKLKENPSVKTKEASDQITIGLQPFIEGRLIKCSPSQISAGLPCTLSVNVTEYGTMTYLWEKDKSILSGIHEKKLVITAATSTDVGNYRFIASNAWGGDTSTIFQLKITSNPKPSITLEPQDNELTVGKTALFTCKAAPSGVVYQWYRNGTLIDAANESAYFIQAVSLQDHNSKFKCKASNAEGFIESREAVLKVFSTDQEPQIVSHPQNVTVSVGEKAVFSIQATGTNLICQWQKNGTDVIGANKSTFEILQVTETDNNAKIRCKISNAINSQVSNEALLTVKAIDPQLKPQITAEPRDLEVNEGTEALFSVTATGKELKYQWKRNG
ncbi:MAG: immunoglobulin domain-containing protein, partial [Chitinivibrionales bacterium]|nr:immunoglobulin domain-containing protein [Chitinivibrionales bacterium]